MALKAIKLKGTNTATTSTDNAFGILLNVAEGEFQETREPSEVRELVFGEHVVPLEWVVGRGNSSTNNR